MLFFLSLPFLLQALVIGLDEFCFHVQRGLPKWERIGHPLDTISVLLCFAFILWFPYSAFYLKIYIGLALFSCIFVTKDEFVHKECCPAKEQWLHAVLFLNHPIVLTTAALLWPLLQGRALFQWMEPLVVYQNDIRIFLIAQTGFITLFCLYQTLYWNLMWKEKAR